MKMKPLVLIIAALPVILASGCASTQKEPNASASKPIVPLENLDQDPRVLSDSELELMYIFGHDRHQFRAAANSQKIQGQSVSEKTVVREAAIEATKYRGFFKRVAEFAQNQATKPPSSADKPGCRAPFIVRARVAEHNFLLTGCRHSKSGSVFGQLTRDAEFLLVNPKLANPKVR